MQQQPTPQNTEQTLLEQLLLKKGLVLSTDQIESLEKLQTVDELLDAIKSIHADQQAKKQDEEFKKTVDEINSLIEKLGIKSVKNIHDLSSHLKSKKSGSGNKGQKKRTVKPSKTRWVDPKNSENWWGGRGQPKAWIKKALIEKGLDPKDNSAVKEFCADNLVKQVLDENTGDYVNSTAAAQENTI